MDIYVLAQCINLHSSPPPYPLTPPLTLLLPPSTAQKPGAWALAGGLEPPPLPTLGFRAKSDVGTLGIKAPEVDCGDYDPARADAFSCGVVFATLALGAPPFILADEVDSSYREWERVAGGGSKEASRRFWVTLLAGQGHVRRRRDVASMPGRRGGGGGEEEGGCERGATTPHDLPSIEPAVRTALHHAAEIMSGLLQPRPETRMTVEEVLRHPWIAARGQGGGGGLSQSELKRIMTVIKRKAVKRVVRAGGREKRG